MRRLIFASARARRYKMQPQVWENAHVYDYDASGGKRKNRRWSEGSTTIKRRDSAGNPVYFLTYSANKYDRH